MKYIDEIQKFCETESGPYRRPFTPNPDWENADVMIIGTNPATPMRDEFDSFQQYWAGLTVDPQLYWSKYSAAHSGRTSKSTGNTNILLKLLEPLNVLVTNVVWHPVEKKKFIPKEEWVLGLRALHALYLHVRPKAIFCHGADAEKFAQSICSTANRYQPVYKQGGNINEGTLVLCYHHFSGQGLRAGASFQPRCDFPVLAKAIHNHVRT